MTRDRDEVADNSDGIGKRFEAAFPEWVELYQPRFTHKDSTSIGRIDRFYTNVPAIEVNDMDISTQAVSTSYTRSASDHIPVSVFDCRQEP